MMMGWVWVSGYSGQGDGGAGLPGIAEGRLASWHPATAPPQHSHWMEGTSIWTPGDPGYVEVLVSVERGKSQPDAWLPAISTSPGHLVPDGATAWERRVWWGWTGETGKLGRGRGRGKGRREGGNLAAAAH